MTQLRRYPGSARLLVHPDGGRGARSVRTLTGSSDWRRSVGDRAGGILLAVTGPSPWPTASTPWTWPTLTPDAIETELRRALPGVRLLGAATPRQAGRERLSLLCRYAGNPLVVKLGVDKPGESIRTEAEVLSMLMRRPLPGIATPEVVAFGQIPSTTTSTGIDFLATSTIGLGAQRPALDVALRTFESDLGVRLAALEPGPSGFVPVHGDLTPWNLRRTSRGLALFDWESAGWGPPGSDIATYRDACNSVRPWWTRARAGSPA